MAEQLELEIDIQDDTQDDEINFKYSITSYGADFDVEGLVRRIRNGDITIPSFQRQFVWTAKQSSRFIESLLLGLPIPGIFLSRESGSQKLLVIDGQQRLRTLYNFYGDSKKGISGFTLKSLESRFNDMTYEHLSSEDRRQLDNSIIHATVVKQDEPDDGNSSIYLIFQRLNTGGTQLQPQEIRTALYHGAFNDALSEFNNYNAWRELYGPPSSRRRDEELILRFFALYFSSEQYKKPMTEFLNIYMNRNKDLKKQTKEDLSAVFYPTVDIIHQAIGPSAFKPRRTLNLAILDSVMIGLARRLEKGPINVFSQVLEQYQELLKNEAYQAYINTGTSDESSVYNRVEMATTAFKNVTRSTQAYKQKRNK